MTPNLGELSTTERRLWELLIRPTSTTKAPVEEYPTLRYKGVLPSNLNALEYWVAMLTPLAKILITPDPLKRTVYASTLGLELVWAVMPTTGLLANVTATLAAEERPATTLGANDTHK